ncbi:uncharacterized protein LOC130010588 [Patella vulgata]|uniref:uncharacterized protein LOC130010588 n=1 Tax=Patella vulgata TaxID=6465 RepID=UPI0024A8351B|nr:uncharacterized protein LOC130010588 [Patella vulgata]
MALNLKRNFRNVPISDATPVAIVSVVFTALSLICLILVFVVYCVFESLRMYVKMSSLTGFTWLIGFIAIITQSEPLIYIFIVINASQGGFLFLSFVCNARVFELIKG